MNVPSIDLETFFIHGAEALASSDVQELRRLTPNLAPKLESMPPSVVEVMQPVIGFATRVLHDEGFNLENAWCREIAFALRYFLKGVDIIPDMLGEIGYADDLAMFRFAFQRNAAELELFASRSRLIVPEC